MALGLPLAEGKLPAVAVRHSSNQTSVVPAARTLYLAEIRSALCSYKRAKATSP